MIAILGGLAAAVMWGTATVSSTRASRTVGAAATLAGVMLVGFAVAVPLALASGLPHGIGRQDVGWLVASGTGNVLGLLLEYRGLRVGKVGVVAALSSTEGAITAAIAIALGERLTPATAILLAAIAAGVVLASLAPRGRQPARDGPWAVGVPYGIGAALSFAVALYATARIGEVLSVAWVLVTARVVGVAAVGVPAIAVGRLRLDRRVLPLIALSGLCELGGFAAFTIGARDGIAVTAVLASQFAAVAAIGAFTLFRERLARLQLLGVGTILVGVAVLAGVRA